MIVVDRFPEVQNEVIRAFNKATLDQTHLYTVDTTGLFDAYLGGFPSAQRAAVPQLQQLPAFH